MAASRMLKISAIHIAAHVTAYMGQGAIPEAFLSDQPCGRGNACGEFVRRGYFYMPLGLDSRAAWRQLRHKDIAGTSKNMAREIVAVMAGPAAEVISLGIRSRNRAELRNVMRTLPGSECDLEFCAQILSELRALTGFGSQKAFEDRAFEFVEARLPTITYLAERLVTSKSKILEVLESFQQQK